MMRMLDLFSGIGGFHLAAEWVWGSDLEVICHCEIDPFCQKILRKHWPLVPIINDIREVTVERIRGIIANTTDAGVEGVRRERQNSVFQNATIDLLTGGFPCQPFSCAGKRKGRDDDRFLWPEMLRVIREVHPTWVVAENVGGIFTQEQGMVFNQVLTDMENEGYEVQPFCIPACAKNAPHRRDRFWFVAHTNGKGSGTGFGKIQGKDEEVSQWNDYAKFEQSDCHAADSECLGWTKGAREDIGYAEQVTKRQDTGNGYSETPWDKNWLEVATRLCRVDDGVSSRLDFNLGRIGYGNTNNFRNVEEAITKISEYRRGILFNMWEKYQSAKTLHRTRLVGVYSGMPEMPYRDTHEEWYLGERIKESKELQDMWSSILSKPFQETFNLQQEMLIRIGEKECNEKMETKRVDRLKSLGNSIVPQVAYEIMKAMKEIEKRR